LLEGIGSDAIGMDCSIVPSQKYDKFSIVSTTDFFYPLVEDPYLQGRIGCANVVSDMYALGVEHIDNVLMILAASLKMEETEREIVTKAFMKGFADCCLLAKTAVTGGQSVLNPWPIIGGVAKSMCLDSDFIEPYNGQIGDVLVLTKPLGTQIAVNVHEWRMTKDQKYDVLKENGIITDDAERLSFNVSSASMIRLNRTAAMLMHKYKAHGATDITGFGPKGHIENLAQNQSTMRSDGIEYEFYVDTLPVIVGMAKVAAFLKAQKVLNFKLVDGFSAETSGGLLVMVPMENADAFIADIERLDGWPAFRIGEVRERTAKGQTVVFEDEDKMQIVEVGGMEEQSMDDVKEDDDEQVVADKGAAADPKGKQ